MSGARMPAKVYYASGIAAAEAGMARKSWTAETGRVAFSDRDNFITNRVTVADYNDAQSMSASGVLGLSTAWACLNLLAGTIASLPLMVYRTDAGGRRTVARNHPLYWLLHDSPNADQTAVDFWEMVCLSLELRGNAFVEIERRANGDVAALGVPISPDMMQVRRLKSGALQYEWSEDGVRHVVSEGRILHIRGFGGGPLGGISTLTFGRQVFGMAQDIDRAASSTFRNGIRPSGVLRTKDTLDVVQRRAIEQKLENRFTGAMNAGVPMLLDRDMQWQQLTINPEDAQMLQSRSFSVEEICRLFAVPPFMVGHTEKSTSWGTGLEQQTLGFQKFTLRRRLKRIEQSLSKQLLTARDRAEGIVIEFNLEGLLRGDSAARAAFYREMTAMKAMTINEVRALENLPPVPWGDRPWGQMQDIQLNEMGVIPAPGDAE